MKTRHNFTLSPEAMQILRAIADEKGLSMSAVLEMLIRQVKIDQQLTKTP